MTENNFENSSVDEMEASAQSKDNTPEKEGAGETVKTIFYAFLIALVFRAFFFEPFNIPSGSMLSTLLVGDYVFVSKYSYGYSAKSALWGIPAFEGRVLGKQPERGDVAVFKLPTNPSIDYIKRVIGLPGDRVQVVNGILHINGKPVERHRVGEFEMVENGLDVTLAKYEETLPNGKKHIILEASDSGDYDNTQVYEVPAGHYFMMGDNRDFSSDSRNQSDVGFVPYENLVGRAEVVFFSLENGTALWQFWKWPFDVRFKRLFSGIE